MALSQQEMEKQIKDLQTKLNGVLKYIEERKKQQISFPVDETSRKNIGLGVIGIKDTSLTTPGGAVTVDSNIGKIKVLIV